MFDLLKVLEKLYQEKHVLSADFIERDFEALLDKTQANSPSMTIVGSSETFSYWESSLPTTGNNNSNRPDKVIRSLLSFPNPISLKIKTPKPSGESMAEKEDKTPESVSARQFLPRSPLHLFSLSAATPVERTQMSVYTTKNTPIQSYVDMNAINGQTKHVE